MSQYTWGIIGPGKIANKFATALTLAGNATLGAIASRDIARARSFAQTHGTSPSATSPSTETIRDTSPPSPAETLHGIRIYDNYEQLAADPAIDAVYIATPHGYHAEHTLLCLRQGKAVLCEKPMALSQGQVKEMVQTARDNKVFLMEAMWTRFLPLMDKVINLVGAGEIGPLQYIRADFGFLSPFNPEGRLYNLRLGGGSLLDIGIYPLYLCLQLLGEPDEIRAAGHLSPTGSDDTCHAVLSWRDGRSAVISSTLACQTSLTAEIAGKEGIITIPAPWYRNDRLLLQKTGEGTQRPLAEPMTIQLEPMVNGFEYQIREVHSCLEKGLIESPLLPHSFSEMMSRVMDTIRYQIGVVYPTE